MNRFYSNSSLVAIMLNGLIAITITISFLSCNNRNEANDSNIISSNATPISEPTETDCTHCHGTGIMACTMCGGTGINNMGVACGCQRYNITMREMGKEPDPYQGPYHKCLYCMGTGRVKIGNSTSNSPSYSTVSEHKVDKDMETEPEVDASKYTATTVNEDNSEKSKAENNIDSSIHMNYQIGQRYQGGLICFIDETNQHGLIVSKYMGWATWETTQIYCKEKHMIDGFNDWRLPSVKEMKDLNALPKQYVDSGLNNKSCWSYELNSDGKSVLGFHFDGSDYYKGAPEELPIFLPNGKETDNGVVFVRSF